MSRQNFRTALVEQAHELQQPAAPVLPPAPASLPAPPRWLPPPPGAEHLMPAPSEPGAIPEFRRANNIVKSRIVLPPQLIDGLLHVGCKMLLAGGSKSFKSWCLLDMGISIAAGVPWWELQTRPGLVLYLNFEILPPFLDKRIVEICEAKGVALPEDLLIWDLRAHCYDLTVLTRTLKARMAALNRPVAAIFIDPIYKALGDMDENSASDMTKLMNLIESFALPSGAAVVFGAHFAKGNASAKEAKDRPSGSGVLIRDPDCILTLTRHEAESCYVVDTELRYLPRHKPFVIEWGHPVMSRRPDLHADQLHDPAKRTESVGQRVAPEAPSFDDEDVLGLLPEGGLLLSSWTRAFSDRYGRAGMPFRHCVDRLVASGRVKKEDTGRFFPTVISLNSQPT